METPLIKPIRLVLPATAIAIALGCVMRAPEPAPPDDDAPGPDAAETLAPPVVGVDHVHSAYTLEPLSLRRVLLEGTLEGAGHAFHLVLSDGARVSLDVVRPWMANSPLFEALEGKQVVVEGSLSGLRGSRDPDTSTSGLVFRDVSVLSENHAFGAEFAGRAIVRDLATLDAAAFPSPIALHGTLVRGVDARTGQTHHALRFHDDSTLALTYAPELADEVDAATWQDVTVYGRFDRSAPKPPTYLFYGDDLGLSTQSGVAFALGAPGTGPTIVSRDHPTEHTTRPVDAPRALPHADLPAGTVHLHSARALSTLASTPIHLAGTLDCAACDCTLVLSDGAHVSLVRPRDPKEESPIADHPDGGTVEVTVALSSLSSHSMKARHSGLVLEEVEPEQCDIPGARTLADLDATLFADPIALHGTLIKGVDPDTRDLRYALRFDDGSAFVLSYDDAFLPQLEAAVDREVTVAGRFMRDGSPMPDALRRTDETLQSNDTDVPFVLGVGGPVGIFAPSED
jgi:hypothetical protein